MHIETNGAERDGCKEDLTPQAKYVVFVVVFDADPITPIDTNANCAVRRRRGTLYEARSLVHLPGPILRLCMMLLLKGVILLKCLLTSFCTTLRCEPATAPALVPIHMVLGRRTCW